MATFKVGSACKLLEVARTDWNKTMRTLGGQRTGWNTDTAKQPDGHHFFQRGKLDAGGLWRRT